MGTVARVKTKRKKTVPRTRRKTAAATQEELRARRQRYALLLSAAAVLLGAVALIPGAHVWRAAHGFLFGMFGPCALLWPPFLLYIAVIAAFDRPVFSIAGKLAELTGMVVLICSAIQIFSAGATADVGRLYRAGQQWRSGGVAGGVGSVFTGLFGRTGAAVTVILLIVLLLLLMTGVTLRRIVTAAVQAARAAKEKRQAVIKSAAVYVGARQGTKRHGAIDIPLGPENAKPAQPRHMPEIFHLPERPEKQPDSGLDELVQKITRLKEGPGDAPAAGAEKSASQPAAPAGPAAEPSRQAAAAAAPAPAATEEKAPPTPKPYVLPPVTLLTGAQPAKNEDVAGELKTNAERLVDTLRSFGVETRITDISRGPAVTRYELQPSAGVKISRITSLADDIALNLAAGGVRIEAPIPNKAAVGIEVPNKVVSVVHIREIIDSDEFRNAQSRLTVALGRDIAGKVALADIAKTPHLLIAGATGSGKSVCINSFLISLLYRSAPEKVKLLLIDPKVVELSVYNGIPHLLVPVVTDPRKAAGALGWAVTEMNNRYQLFAEQNVRDIRGYNAQAARSGQFDPIPQIVIVIDELADLIQTAPGEVEEAIQRLAQKARAAGMHLVIATQRPSVDVITGVIKANIPSRIAFAVSSQVDSRTILDSAGAEKLLGRGDMLFLPLGASKPRRVQGCFVSDDEVESVIDHIKKGVEAEYDEDVMDEIEKQSAKEKGKDKEADAGGDDADEMLPRAIECVVEAGQASTSLLQRRLKLGYARAARIIDEMESRGIVGPFEGSKPRQVLISREQWIEMSMNSDGQ